MCEYGVENLIPAYFFLWEAAFFFFYLSVEMGGSRPKGSPIRLIVFYDPRQPVINVVIQ